jgi:HSP20 family protein
MKIELLEDARTLDRELDELFRPFFALPLPRFAGRTVPPIDVFYRDGALVVRADLPGIDPSKVAVTVQKGTLVIRGERTRKESIANEKFVQQERGYGEFERRILIPEDVDEDQIRARYVDGVLEITIPLPKEVVAAPKAISINAEPKVEGS